MDPRNQPSLLERIYSWENLLDAYHEAASEKWYRNDVTAFAANLEENLISIQNDLIWHTYKVGRYRQFYVHEPKKRLVMALGFRDRVVQWAIYLQTNQYLDNGMIYHSYECRVGKGTTRAADRLQYWCTLVDRKPGKWYYLKLDVSKYFYRVDHRVLLDILRRKFPNEDGYLWLMETIINCDHTPFGLPPGKSADEIPPSERLFEVGMPIGNLTSQLLANVCLNELDQYIKHELKAHFYDRYMDDMALLYPDAATLNRWRAAIEKYLNEVLHLELNSKTTIGLVKHGITFVGCRIYPGVPQTDSSVGQENEGTYALHSERVRGRADRLRRGRRDHAELLRTYGPLLHSRAPEMDREKYYFQTQRNGRHRAAAGGDTMGIESVLIACLPSAITGFCFWCIEQKIQKQSKKLEKEEKQRREAQDKREKLHEQQELFLVQGVNAAIALGEATARAVQRIPDANCNGDMHAALDYAAKVKHDQKDFLTRQGIESIYES